MVQGRCSPQALQSFSLLAPRRQTGVVLVPQLAHWAEACCLPAPLVRVVGPVPLAALALFAFMAEGGDGGLRIRGHHHFGVEYE